MSITLTDRHREVAAMAGTLVHMARILPPEALEALDEIIAYGRQYDTVGPILDPTGWMQSHRKNEQDTRIFAAVRTFRRELDKIAAESEAQA